MTEQFNYLYELKDPNNIPNIDTSLLPKVSNGTEYKPRILLLYGSLRENSYSRMVAEESARILIHLGAEVRIFDPRDLPLMGQGDTNNTPAVMELREHVLWSDGQVWSSPEIHGNMSGLMKTQIDHIPLSMGAIRPSQGRTLAVMQVSGGSQSFNAVNNMRILGRWMRMITIPNQSSVAKVWQEFDDNGRMKNSSYYSRIVDVMEELVRFTKLLSPHSKDLVDRYSERLEKQATG